ncbi:MAG: hypothetical protein M1575_03600 [Patescibacteria group bacterium]|nr:hypothetical protein [Patescibacteria group bacterium]
MQNKTDNLCIRCGKPRVDVKTWKECVKGITFTHTTTSCPDPECQKLVDKQFAVEKAKKEAIEKEKLQRMAANKLAHQKTSKKPR